MSASRRSDQLATAKRKRLQESVDGDKTQPKISAFFARSAAADVNSSATGDAQAVPAVGARVEEAVMVTESVDQKTRLDSFAEIAKNTIGALAPVCSRMEVVSRPDGTLSITTTASNNSAPTAQPPGRDRPFSFATRACSTGCDHSHIDLFPNAGLVCDPCEAEEHDASTGLFVAPEPLNAPASGSATQYPWAPKKAVDAEKRTIYQRSRRNGKGVCFVIRSGSVYSRVCEGANGVPCCNSPKYRNSAGQLNRLCTTHARLQGSYAVQNPCELCPENAKLKANYPNSAGQLNRLCATHARLEGSYAVQNPCELCPENAKLQASYPNSAGQLNRLCATHARLEGSYAVLNPCELCPENAKLQANYPNSAGQLNRLCATHARLEGSYAVQNPCELCPENAKIQASYPNSAGQLNRLCAIHARLEGSHTVQRPCELCPENAKLQASYPNSAGQPCRLCATHAVAVGTLAATASGTSREASQFFDDVRAKLRHAVQNRVTLRAGHPPTGSEKRGLLPGHPHMKPDGFDPPSEHENHKGTVWQYHGTHFHGYPPHHPLHESYVHNNRWSPDCYQDTVRKMQLYKDAGYRVLYVWSYEYAQTTKANPRPLAEVIHEF